MRKTIFVFSFIGVTIASTAVYAQKEERITVTTYYPSPSGVYQTIRLNPSATPPANARAGQLYYNSTYDLIQYYNKTGNWTNITAGKANGTIHLDPVSNFTGTPTAGDIYFNNTSNQILYYTKANTWVSMGGTSYWAEGALSPKNTTSGNETAAFYPRYLVNSTNRRVGIGTNTPKATLSVYQAENSGVNENVTIANFSRFFTATNKFQSMAISLYPNGTGASPSPSYMDSTSLISVPAGNLHIAAANPARAISFNVGGYDTSATEVMTLINPCGSSRCQRVGIGNSTPPFALFVDSTIDNTTAFGLRGKRTVNKSGIATITPYNDSVWITMGVYLENGIWKHDKFTYIGAESRNGAALVIKPDAGVFWYAYNVAGLINNNTIVDNWSQASGVRLWNAAGVIGSSSSRKLKENFTPLNPDDILQRFDKLPVTRYNYKPPRSEDMHIGTVAEDFNKIFELGTQPGYITYMDEAGVSLSGVKALSYKIKAQQKRIKELQAELEDLESHPSLRR